MKIEIKKIGNSTGIILPKDILTRLGLAPGDELVLTIGPDQTITLSPDAADDAETMRIAREVMDEYKTTLRALAK